MSKETKISELLIKVYGATYAALLSNGDNAKHSNGIYDFGINRVERTIQGARHGDVELARTVLATASVVS